MFFSEKKKTPITKFYGKKNKLTSQMQEINNLTLQFSKKKIVVKFEEKVLIISYVKILAQGKKT